MTAKNTLDELKKQAAENDAQIKKLQTMINAEEQREKEKADAITAGQAPSTFTPNRSGSSLEAKTLSAFGCKNLNDLLHVNTAHKKFGHVDPMYKGIAHSVKEQMDIGRWIGQIYGESTGGKAGFDHFGDSEKQDKLARVGILDTYYGKSEIAPIVKAFSSTTPGSGQDWVPTAHSSQFIEEFQLERKVANSFRDMPMPTNPFKLNVQTDVTTARIATENTAMTGANFGTSNITFTATKLGEFYPLPEELNEDSAPNILALARTEVTEAQIRAREQIILNGDNSGTHMDFDVDGLGADDARKTAKGLRRLAIDNSANGSLIDFGAAAVTTPKLDEMRTTMGKFGVGVRDLAIIFSPTTYHQAVSLNEVSTVEKFGQQATILTGALAAHRGIPILISEFVRDDTELATGVNANGGTNDKGVCYMVNMKRFWVGMRRPIRVRVMQDLADQDRWLLSSYQRLDFQGHAQSATELSTVLGVNILIS